MFDDIFSENMAEIAILKCEEEKNNYIENYKKLRELYDFLINLKLESSTIIFKELLSYIDFLSQVPKSFLTSFIKLGHNINTLSNNVGIIIDLEELAYESTGNSIHTTLNNLIDNFSMNLFGATFIDKTKAKFSAVINKIPVFTLATASDITQTSSFIDDTTMYFDINNNARVPADEYLKLITSKDSNKASMPENFNSFGKDKTIAFYTYREHKKLTVKNDICNKFIKKINQLINDINCSKDRILDIIISLKYNSPNNYVHFNEDQKQKMMYLADSTNNLAKLLDKFI